MTSSEKAWQIAFAAACALAAILYFGKGTLAPLAPLLNAARKALPNLPPLLKPAPLDDAFDYGPTSDYAGKYSQDGTGGVLPACNGCGPVASIRFFGSLEEQAAALAAFSR